MSPPLSVAPTPGEPPSGAFDFSGEEQAKTKGIDLTLSVPTPTTVFADRELLALILQNLISNAVKYTPKGKVEVSASTTPAGLVQIAVSDNGPGIPAQRLPTLFDPFVRGDTHGQSGVGLGLSIARQAADLIKAKLWAESEQGKGAKFVLELRKP